jgi:hypothetical protein
VIGLLLLSPIASSHRENLPLMGTHAGRARVDLATVSTPDPGGRRCVGYRGGTAL